MLEKRGKLLEKKALNGDLFAQKHYDRLLSSQGVVKLWECRLLHQCMKVVNLTNTLICKGAIVEIDEKNYTANQSPCPVRKVKGILSSKNILGILRSKLEPREVGYLLIATDYPDIVYYVTAPTMWRAKQLFLGLNLSYNEVIHCLEIKEVPLVNGIVIRGTIDD